MTVGDTAYYYFSWNFAFMQCVKDHRPLYLKAEKERNNEQEFEFMYTLSEKWYARLWTDRVMARGPAVRCNGAVV